MVPKSCSNSNYHIYIPAKKAESGKKAKCMLTLFLRNVSLNYHMAHTLMFHWPEPTRLLSAAREAGKYSLYSGRPRA